MRKDMSKVIVERPRPGSRSRTDGSFRQALKHAANEAMLGKDLDEVDDLGDKLGMTKLHHDRRSFNEYFAPLRRYVLSQVGRPWNDVYSEICEHLNRDSTVHDHIFVHLFQFVERNTYMDVDGVICVNTQHGSWVAKEEGRTPIDRHYCDSYVHPVTGILVKQADDVVNIRRGNNKAYADRLAEERRYKRYADGKIFIFDKEIGCWFKNEVIPARDAWNTEIITEYHFNLHSFLHACREKYGAEVYPSTKRQTASKKDIKQYGLNRS